VFVVAILSFEDAARCKEPAFMWRSLVRLGDARMSGSRPHRVNGHRPRTGNGELNACCSAQDHCLLRLRDAV
jgi:hypothetical protein